MLLPLTLARWLEEVASKESASSIKAVLPSLLTSALMTMCASIALALTSVTRLPSDVELIPERKSLKKKGEIR